MQNKKLYTVKTIKISSENIWNHDETNLNNDTGKKMITTRGYKYLERVINSTKTSVSVLC